MEMISDGERRRVAKRLHELADVEIGETDSGKKAIWLAYEAEVATGTSAMDNHSDILNRYADLIDRPTCRDVNAKAKGPACDMFECSECGFEINTWDMDGGWKRIYYCPNCGAQVVRDE